MVVIIIFRRDLEVRKKSFFVILYINNSASFKKSMAYKRKDYYSVTET